MACSKRVLTPLFTHRALLVSTLLGTGLREDAAAWNTSSSILNPCNYYFFLMENVFFQTSKERTSRKLFMNFIYDGFVSQVWLSVDQGMSVLWDEQNWAFLTSLHPGNGSCSQPLPAAFQGFPAMELLLPFSAFWEPSWVGNAKFHSCASVPAAALPNPARIWPGSWPEEIVMIMLRVHWGQGQAALTGFEPTALQGKSF